MDEPDIVFFTRKRPASKYQADKEQILDANRLKSMENLFGSHLSAFQSIDSEDTDLLRILRSNDSNIGESQSLGTLAALESWASFSNISPACNRCGGPCGNDSVYIDGLIYHQKHFTCRKCNAPIKEPVLINNEIYCTECALKGIDRFCSICGATKGLATISGKSFCQKHFRCSVCNKKLKNDTVRFRMGKLFCNNHVPPIQDNVCTACNRVICKEFISFGSQKYHPDCFNCSICNTNLANLRYTTIDSKPVCPQCYKNSKKQAKKNEG